MTTHARALHDRIRPITRSMLSTQRGLPAAPVPWQRHGTHSLYAMPSSGYAPTLSVSIIVPAWNSEGSLPACVMGLDRALSAFPAGRAEIILVDDGSRYAAADAIAHLRLRHDIEVVRVDHQGQSRATNAGAARASGDVLVFCDSDMILNPWSILSLLSAIDQWPDALCFGFREPVEPAEVGDIIAKLEEQADAVPLLSAGDNRFVFDLPGVPTHLFAASRGLEDLTGDRRMYPPGRTAWSLPRMAFGCLLACRRDIFVQLGGFDGRFVRWGYNDTELSSRWIASGRPLAPVFTAGGLHVEHAIRHPLQWRMAGTAANLYERSLEDGWVRPHLHCSPVQNVTVIKGRPGVISSPPLILGSPAVATAAARLGDLDLYQVATGMQAIDAAKRPSMSEVALQVLRLSGDRAYFDVRPAEPDSPASALEAGLWAAAVGDFPRARQHLSSAARDPQWLYAATARQLLYSLAARRLRLAEIHAGQGLSRAAASCALAALVGDDSTHYRQRAMALLDAVPLDDRRIF